MPSGRIAPHDALHVIGIAVNVPHDLVRDVRHAVVLDEPQPTGLAGRVLTARDLSDRYGTTDVDGSRPDAWGYIRDHGFGDERVDLIPDYR